MSLDSNPQYIVTRRRETPCTFSYEDVSVENKNKKVRVYHNKFNSKVFHKYILSDRVNKKSSIYHQSPKD